MVLVDALGMGAVATGAVRLLHLWINALHPDRNLCQESSSNCGVLIGQTVAVMLGPLARSPKDEGSDRVEFVSYSFKPKPTGLERDAATPCREIQDFGAAAASDPVGGLGYLFELFVRQIVCKRPSVLIPKLLLVALRS